MPEDKDQRTFVSKLVPFCDSFDRCRRQAETRKTGTGGTLDSWTLDDGQNDDVGSLTMTEEEDDDYRSIHSLEICHLCGDSDDEGLDSIMMFEPHGR